jgi:PmbA protein
MTTKRIDELLDLAGQVVDKAKKLGADVAEATAREGAHLTTKVRMREPELVEEAGSRAIGLRVMLGKQVAVTYTSDLSAGGIDRMVEDAVDLAKLSQPDEFAGPPDPSLLSTPDQHPDLNLFDAEMSTLDGAESVRRAMAGEAAAFDHDDRITNSEGATFSRMDGGSAIVTSGGFRGSMQGTYASLSVRPVAKDGDGKNRTGSYWGARRHLSELKSEAAIGKEAAVRTLRKLGARKVETQEVAVVFDPDAARSILGLLAGCINGAGIWRKSSYLADRLETQVASELMSVVDDPLIPKAPGSRPFDGEGLLSRRNTIVEKGVLKSYLIDSYCGRKLKMESTASASRGSSGGVGPSTSNFVMQAGEMSPEDLLKSTPKGLYVTEMMGFGFNGVTGDFSRGASGFWIENGELAFPVSEVTISLNLDDMLKGIDAVANDLDLRTATACPTFRISSMTLAGK